MTGANPEGTTQVPSGPAASAKPVKRTVVCKLADVRTGELLPVRYGRARLLVTRTHSGELRAISARCPHQGADMAAGKVTCRTVHQAQATDRLDIGLSNEDDVVRCPWHGFEFDIATGLPVVPSPSCWTLRLRTFKLETDGDDVVLVT